MSALFHIVQDDAVPIPSFVSPELKEFLQECFKKVPTFRRSAAGLMGHAWIVNAGLALANQHSAQRSPPPVAPAAVQPRIPAVPPPPVPGAGRPPRSGTPASAATSDSEDWDADVAAPPPAPLRSQSGAAAALPASKIQDMSNFAASIRNKRLVAAGGGGPAPGTAVTTGDVETVRMATEARAAQLAMGVMYMDSSSAEDSDEALAALKAGAAAKPVGGAGHTSRSAPADGSGAARGPITIGIAEMQQYEELQAAAQAQALKGLVLSHKKAESAGGSIKVKGGPSSSTTKHPLGSSSAQHSVDSSVTNQDIQSWKNRLSQGRPRLALGPPGFASGGLNTQPAAKAPQLALSSDSSDDNWDEGLPKGGKGGAPGADADGSDSDGSWGGPATTGGGGGGSGASSMRARLAAKLGGSQGVASALSAALADKPDDESPAVRKRPAGASSGTHSRGSPRDLLAADDSDDDDFSAVVSAARARSGGGLLAKAAPAGVAPGQATADLSAWADSDEDASPSVGGTSASSSLGRATVRGGTGGSGTPPPGRLAINTSRDARRHSRTRQTASTPARALTAGLIRGIRRTHTSSGSGTPPAFYGRGGVDPLLRQQFADALSTLLANLGTELPHSALLSNCSSLHSLLRDKPEVRATFVERHGLLTLLELMKTWSAHPQASTWLLRVLNTVVGGDSGLVTSVCMVGGLPLIMRFTAAHCTPSTRLQAGLFVHRVVSGEAQNLRLFVGCAGVDALVQLMLPSDEAQQPTPPEPLKDEDVKDLAHLNSLIHDLVVGPQHAGVIPATFRLPLKGGEGGDGGAASSALTGGADQTLLRVGLHGLLSVVMEESGRRVSHNEFRRLFWKAGVMGPLVQGLRGGFYYVCNVLCHCAEDAAGVGITSTMSSRRSSSTIEVPAAQQPPVTGVQAALAAMADSDDSGDAFSAAPTKRGKGGPKRSTANWTLTPDAFRRQMGGANATRGGSRRPSDRKARPLLVPHQGGGAERGGHSRGLSLAQRTPTSSEGPPSVGSQSQSSTRLVSVARSTARRTAAMVAAGGTLRSGAAQLVAARGEDDDWAYDGETASGSEDSAASSRVPGRTAWAPHGMLDVAVASPAGGAGSSSSLWEMERSVRAHLSELRAPSSTTRPRFNSQGGGGGHAVQGDPWAALPDLPPALKTIVTGVLLDMSLIMEMLQYMAQGDNSTKSHMGSRPLVSALLAMLRPAPLDLLWHPLYTPLLLNACRTLQHLSGSESAQSSIAACGGVEALVTFLAHHTGLVNRDALGVPRTPVSSARSFTRLQSDLQAPIINSLLLLCRVHSSRRRTAAAAGILLPLRALVFRERYPLQPFAVMLATQLAQAGGVAHAALWEADGVALFIRLLRMPGWTLASLQALGHWAASSKQEARLHKALCSSSRVQILASTIASSSQASELFKPLKSLLGRAPRLAAALAAQSALIARLAVTIRDELRSISRTEQLRTLVQVADSLLRAEAQGGGVAAAGLGSALREAARVTAERNLGMLHDLLSALVAMLP